MSTLTQLWWHLKWFQGLISGHKNDEMPNTMQHVPNFAGWSSICKTSWNKAFWSNSLYPSPIHICISQSQLWCNLTEDQSNYNEVADAVVSGSQSPVLRNCVKCRTRIRNSQWLGIRIRSWLGSAMIRYSFQITAASSCIDWYHSPLIHMTIYTIGLPTFSSAGSLIYCNLHSSKIYARKSLSLPLFLCGAQCQTNNAKSAPNLSCMSNISSRAATLFSRETLTFSKPILCPFWVESSEVASQNPHCCVKRVGAAPGLTCSNSWPASASCCLGSQL